MADKFFEDTTVDDQQVQDETTKIKVGEKEYDADELNRLVGLGEIAVEAEEKYNRPISKFWPEYTKTQQELLKAQEELEGFKKQSQPKADLTSEDQIKDQAREELNKLGYIPADQVEKRAREIASEVVAGYKLIDQVDSLVEKQKADGNPATSRDELLAFMQEKNLNEPELAYKIKFEKELDEIKERKLRELKPQGLHTESSSTAGGKQPAPVNVTKENLPNVLSGYFK